MKTKDFLAAARTLSTDHGLSVVGSLKERGWAIASEIAEDLEIHISTASKDLSILYDCGLLDRRMSRRKTRPAYEYRLKSDRISLELDIQDVPRDVGDELNSVYIFFFDRLFHKTQKMGWGPLESSVAKALGDGGARVGEIVARELSSAKSSEGVAGIRSVFRKIIDKVRRIFMESLGEAATDRMFQATASEVCQEFPALAEKYPIEADLGVVIVD